MDIEHLTKTQIVLLTLLVSFVTSIATGIVTVSLMQQAPPVVAQTVNRIVERTVEKVVPAAQTAAVVREKTVVIKESDLIAEALKEVRPSIVQVYTTSEEAPVFLGLGLVLSKDGSIVTDVSGVGTIPNVIVVQDDGERIAASVNVRDSGASLVYLSTATSTREGKPAIWTPATLATARPVLGQSIFTMTGSDVGRISDGIVTALQPGDNGPSYIETDVDGSAIVAGSPLINTSGEVLGISSVSSRQKGGDAFISVLAISPKEKPTGTSSIQ